MNNNKFGVAYKVTKADIQPVNDESNFLLDSSRTADREQQSLLELSSNEQAYQSILSVYVEAKHEQVERVVDRLESLIEQQEARLQRLQSSPPGLLSLPSTKRDWQAQQSLQQARLQSLHTRLDVVRDIRDGMGLHIPKLEELAARKMRQEKPEITNDWDSMQEAGRKHLLLMKQKLKEKSQHQAQGRTQTLGISI